MLHGALESMKWAGNGGENRYQEGEGEKQKRGGVKKLNYIRINLQSNSHRRLEKQLQAHHQNLHN